jgi:toxin ParE1/3/4
MRIEWLPQALADFDDAMNWIAERNPQAATSTAKITHLQIFQLAAHPMMGRPGRVPDTRELVISQTHFIAPYRVRPQQNLIEILAFMHDARQWPENF